MAYTAIAIGSPFVVPSVDFNKITESRTRSSPISRDEHYQIYHLIELNDVTFPVRMFLFFHLLTEPL